MRPAGAALPDLSPLRTFFLTSPPLLCRSSPGLPYAIAGAGFYTGLFLLVALCLVTDWTIRLIVLNAKMSGRNSYIDVRPLTRCPARRVVLGLSL